MTDSKNVMIKNVTLAIQKELANVLIIKRAMLTKKLRDTRIIFLHWIYKIVLSKFCDKGQRKMKRNKVLAHYLKGLKDQVTSKRNIKNTSQEILEYKHNTRIFNSLFAQLFLKGRKLFVNFTQTFKGKSP